MKMTGNTILITGGGSGIGLALAKDLIRNHNTVIICGRNPQKLQIAKQEFPELDTFVCDISDPEQRQSLFDSVKTQFPSLNVLINNAGILNVLDLTRLHPVDPRINQEVEINFLAPINMTLTFLPLLMQQPQAAIVNVSSGLTYVPDAGTPIYSASKAALHSFTQSLRYKLQHTAIQVFEVLPPGVNTDLNTDRLDKISPTDVAKETLQAMAKGISEIRVGQAKILYFISRLAPNWIHGVLNNQISKARAERAEKSACPEQ